MRNRETVLSRRVRVTLAAGGSGVVKELGKYIQAGQQEGGTVI